MTFCAQRSSLTAQPPLTIPEIALRLGVHPSYYQNGIEVFELARLPTVKEFGPAARATDGDIADLMGAWAEAHETLLRVVAVDPPPVREDGRHVWRFDGGTHANEEVFLPGQTVPQWDVDTRAIKLRKIAVVPPGGVLLMASADERAAREKDGHGGSGDLGLTVAGAAFSVAVTYTSRELTDDHEHSHALEAHDESGQEAAVEPGQEEAAVYHEPGQEEGVPQQLVEDDAHLGGQDAEPAAEALFTSESAADDDIIDHMNA